MRLSEEEQRMLNGEQGAGVQKAMELLVAVGEGQGAERMIPVTYTHVASPEMWFWTTGKLGAWAQELTADSIRGAKGVKVNTTIEPFLCDPDLMKNFGYPQAHVEEMKKSMTQGMNSYTRLGVIPIYSCCPFFTLPSRKGEHIAVSETTVQLFSNSILGAMTNRESTVTALASALTGRTPLYGLHLPENRLGQVLVELKDDLNPRDITYSDYSALSYYAAGQALDKIPVYIGLPDDISMTKLLMFAHSHCNASNLAMFHVVGITPEAPTLEAALGGKKPVARIEVGKKEIKGTYEAVCSAGEEKINWVLLGCPHATLEQMGEAAKLLEGKRIHDRVKLILATNEPIRVLAQSMGFVDAIQDAGGFVGSGICPALFVQRDVPPGYKIGVVAVDSANAASLHKLMGVQAWFGNLEKCIKAAITGTWEVD